jgi:hypothetical protein
MRDNTSCRNDATVAYGHTWADNDSTADPAVLANADWMGDFFWFASLNVVGGVVWGVELAVWSDFGV